MSLSNAIHFFMCGFVGEGGSFCFLSRAHFPLKTPRKSKQRYKGGILRILISFHSWPFYQVY